MPTLNKEEKVKDRRLTIYIHLREEYLGSCKDLRWKSFCKNG